MNYTKAILFIISFAIALLFFSCDLFNETEELKPGRRDYTWTVDTLDVNYGILTDIWGSTADDLWAIGPIDSDENLWHYDGNNWSKKQVPNNINPEAIFGFAEDDIWICGGNKAFWHYDGIVWTKTDEFEIDGYPRWGPTTLWGDSPNNVYMAGAKQDSEVKIYSLLMHYNGKEWQIIEIPTLKEVFMVFNRGTKESKNYYLWTLGEVIGDNDTSRIYEVNGKELKEIYKGEESKGKFVSIASIDNEMYFTFGKSIKKYNGKEFYTVFEIPYENYGRNIFGRNRNDLFFLMQDGMAHYNGSNIKYIYNHEHNNVHVLGMMAFEEEVILLVYDFTNHLNLVIKGKLN